MAGYFDNAATTLKKPKGMYEYVANYMSDCGANIGRGNYAAALQGSSLAAKTREKLLSLVGASEIKTVVFLSSATVALNTILYGLNLKKGDVIYISHFEHNAILRPLYKLEATVGIKIKFLPMQSSHQFAYDLETIEKAFVEEPPTVVVVSQVSNVFGVVAPITEISLLAKKSKATMVVDAAQACGIVDCDLKNVDFYVFDGHKTLLAPTGIGGFICDRNTKLQPLIVGGTGIDSANREMPSTVPERFEAGTMNLMSIVGLSYSLEWILNNKCAMREAEKSNLHKLYSILSAHSFIQIVSPYPESVSMVTCKVKGYTSDEFGRILSERGIAVRTGLHCAPEAHKYAYSFPEGLVRFSVSCFTDEEDFVALKKVLNEISIEI